MQAQLHQPPTPVLPDLENLLKNLLTIASDYATILLHIQEEQNHGKETYRTQDRRGNIESPQGTLGTLLRVNQPNVNQADRGQVHPDHASTQQEKPSKITANKVTSLKQTMHDNGIKRPWLAKKLGVSTSYIYQIEGGKRSVSKHIADNISKLLELPEQELFADIKISHPRTAYKDKW